MRFTRPRSDAAQQPPRWRRLPSHVSRHYPRRGAPDVPLQRDVQGRAARHAGPGGTERHREGRAATEEPVRRGARALERGRGPALLPRDARAAHPRRLRPREPAARPGRRRRPVRRRRGARRGDAQDGAPGTAPGGLRHTHCRARCSRGRGSRASGCYRPAGDVAARGGAGLRAVAHRMRARRRGHRAGGRRAGVVQRGRWRRALPALPANALPAPAAEPAAAPGVPRSPRPERLAGGAPRAGSAACRGSPPPRRSIRPLSPRRGRLTFRPGLLGASRVGASPSHSHTDPLRRFVIGTAGHIDHGKTALVKALTGVDTDRWEEEKRRGITIDLGFAPLPLDDAIQASVVDVPGHEGFVRNMLAGATGIDVALLVIAADEGIMPQTEEHLAIVELLGVCRGIPVITKRDLVEQEWLDLVRGEITERLKASRVRWDAPVATSAVTGEGLDELRAVLRRVADDLVERPADDVFRLPIDRVFAVAGAGTVVTGSTWSGAVAVGEAVRLLPLGREVRVRSIEVHGQGAERAMPGRRTALALVGVDKSELERGHVAVTGPGWQAATALDAAVELLPGARKPAGGPRRGPLRAALVLAGDDDWRGRGARSVSPRPLPPAAAPHRGGAGPGRPPRHVRGGGRARGVGGSEPRRAAGSAAGPCDRSHRGGGGGWSAGVGRHGRRRGRGGGRGDAAGGGAPAPPPGASARSRDVVAGPPGSSGCAGSSGRRRRCGAGARCPRTAIRDRGERRPRCRLAAGARRARQRRARAPCPATCRGRVAGA